MAPARRGQADRGDVALARHAAGRLGCRRWPVPRAVLLAMALTVVARRRRRAAAARSQRVRGEAAGLEGRAAPCACRSPQSCSPTAPAPPRPWVPAKPSRATSRRPPGPCCRRRAAVAPRPRSCCAGAPTATARPTASSTAARSATGASSARCRCSTARSDALAAYARAADLAPEDAEAQMLRRRPAPAGGQSCRGGEPRSAARSSSATATARSFAALPRPHHAGRRARRARGARCGAWRPTRRRSAR